MAKSSKLCSHSTKEKANLYDDDDDIIIIIRAMSHYNLNLNQWLFQLSCVTRLLLFV